MKLTGCFVRQAHIGIKGDVIDSRTKRPIANALIHVANLTTGVEVDINHDVTSGQRQEQFRDCGWVHVACFRKC